LGYDFLTAYYDLAIKITMPEKKFRKLLIKEINPKADERVLEFGFGTGQNLLLVHKANPITKLEGLILTLK
jgi:ubiquinone/menaquinone biosynthesis C-methylase UbiE